MEHYEGITRGLSVLARDHQNYMAKRLADAGIGPGQYFYVLVINRNPGIGQDQLAREMMINKSTVARAVAQLEENGYIRREVNPEDGRALMLYPTGKVEEALPLIHECLRDSGARITEGMEEADAAALSELLQKALQNLCGRRLREEETSLPRAGGLPDGKNGEKPDTR